jgi:FixJ family two-component response regulator
MSPRSAVVHVVDDDDAFRTAVSRLLKVAGYETKGYRSAGDFLLDPPVAGPGCILLDLRMPGPSGIELQKAIAKTGLGFPVIFLTGRGDVRQSVLAMRQGAVDFLTKPVQRKELLAAVEEALKRQSTEGANAGRRSEMARRFETLTVREREARPGSKPGRSAPPRLFWRAAGTRTFDASSSTFTFPAPPASISSAA